MLKKVKKLRFNIYISYDEYEKYYQGIARNVRVRTDNGQTIVFPANRLQPFLTHDGINGHFEIVFDEDNKFVQLRQVSN